MNQKTDCTGCCRDTLVPIAGCPCTPEEIVAEACPVPVSFQLAGCQEAAGIGLQEVELSGLGRIVQLDVKIKNVCPGKRVAVAVQLTEMGPGEKEEPRGMKFLTVPAHSGKLCSDVIVRCVRFVLPEDLSREPDSVCKVRYFRARVMANYLDTDYICCDTKIEIS